ncbi:MAG TPA: OsmC family protein [Rhizomicrobium sp.]|jgi:putative redox protein|nr:OsmC family protein [Rhizomicrobium sp.]
MSEEHERTIAHANAVIKLADARYRADIRAGHHDIISDEGPGGGGLDAGPNPFALVTAGLGACTVITLRMYAERKGWTFTGLSVALTCYRDENRTVKIDRTLTIEGMDAEQSARMAEIAEKTPVTLALRAGIPIATTLA